MKRAGVRNLQKKEETSERSGSNIFTFMVWVEFGKFPLKMSNFSIFFLSGQKKSLRVGSENNLVEGRFPFIYCWSKVSSGRVRAHL